LYVRLAEAGGAGKSYMRAGGKHGSAHAAPEDASLGSSRFPLLIGLAICGIGLLLSSLLYLAAQTVDHLSEQRERALIGRMISMSIKQVAQNQESTTVWDDAIVQLRRTPLDDEWLDLNVGVWLHSYFGLDEVYVLAPDGRPVYAMQNGRRIAPESFNALRTSAAPFIAASRQAMLAAGEDDPDFSKATDVGRFGRHPAIVSVRPFITDTGRIEQAPGSEFLHIAVRRLDGSFLQQFSRDYHLNLARFSWRPQASDDEIAFPWRTATGETVAYLIWTPFQPGTHFLRETAPLLAVSFILIALVTGSLVRKVYIGTLQLQKSQAQAQHLALHDPLTGLPNRALFDERLQRALDSFRAEPERQVALLYLDLDRFKQVNDTLGHPAGDQLIQELGQRFRRAMRPSDTLARLGGDEFAVIQTNVRSRRETEQLCARLVEVAMQPFSLREGQAFIGVSIGVAFAGVHGRDTRELARKADIALYESKGQGRGCFRIFRDELDEPLKKRETIERELRAALEGDGQLSVWFQPQFAASTGTPTAVEALVRWDHPERGPIAPASFIPTAEESGLIQMLGEFVLRQACRNGAQWPELTICVNVSPVQLRNPHFARRVLEILEETGLTPDRLELEITETALIANAQECQPNLKLLRMVGVRVALDDFGTGYSSLRHLADFEVDRLKIDRSFVQEVGGAATGAALVQAIVDLAQSVGLQVTAEGVETQEQNAYLQRIGCDDVQGFLLAAPMPAQQMHAFVAAHPVAPATDGPDPAITSATHEPPKLKAAG
jgi:diguanylate cyclase (GGDEF)-like protein